MSDPAITAAHDKDGAAGVASAAAPRLRSAVTADLEELVTEVGTEDVLGG
ncbi:hypothetical protein G3I76_50840 [Streptomyces sp. SID11233]|nr:hypothetical protein [Streptomyces sp. SID11233]